MRNGAIIIALAFLLGACSENNPGLILEKMDPQSGLVGQVTKVRILGHGFRPRFQAIFDDKDKAGINDTFSARLGEHALEQVRYVNSGELTAEVPASLDPGPYDLVVVDPDRLQGTLAGAFTVDGPADGGPDDADAKTDSGPDGPTPDGLGPDQTVPDLTMDQPTPYDQKLVDQLSPPDVKKWLGIKCYGGNECLSSICVKKAFSWDSICCLKQCRGGMYHQGCVSSGQNCNW